MDNRMSPLLIAFIVIFLLGALFIWTQAPIWKAKDAVRRELVDPDSAQFRDVYVKGLWTCGEVNAKNSLGGYVGFRRFSTMGSIVWIDNTPGLKGSSSPTVADMISGNCDEKRPPVVPVSRFPKTDRKRNEFEAKDSANGRDLVESVLAEKRIKCRRLFIYPEVARGATILVDCRDMSGEEADYLINTQDRTLSGPFAPLAD